MNHERDNRFTQNSYVKQTNLGRKEKKSVIRRISEHSKFNLNMSGRARKDCAKILCHGAYSCSRVGCVLVTVAAGAFVSPIEAI